MPSSVTTGLGVLCLVLGHVLPLQAAAPNDIAGLVNQPVVLTLTDGRMPQGTLSPKSNADWLVLSTELPDIQLESRFAAAIVEDVQSFADIRSNESPSQPAIPPAPVPDDDLLPFPQPCCGLQMPDALEIVKDLSAIDYRNSVHSLRIETRLGNWDRDAELDGLLMRVQPVDGWGRVVPVDGNLDVQLATEAKLATGGQSIRRDDSFRITERWSVPIRAIEFDATGTVVRLPFRRFHPERDFDIAPDALAVARLRLPTAGAFDASDPFVVLRPASRFRDDLQEHRNQRLLPIEGRAR